MSIRKLSRTSRLITISNDDITLAWEFHNGTKLLDGELNKIHPDLFNPPNRPRLYKDYLAKLDSVELIIPDEIEEVDTMPTLESIEEKEERFPYLETLARILHYSAGITKRITRTRADEKHTFDFRAASCTGALYHIELYVITARIPGLRAGIYHYDPEQSRLQLLRKGDYRQALIDASGQNYDIEDSPTILAYTTNFWRNAYKYKTRAYRHAFWDSGTIMAQSLAIASLLNLSTSIVTGFVDDQVSALLGLEKDEELPLALLPIGYTGYAGLNESPPIDPEVFEAKDQEFQRQFEPILKMAQASSLTSPQEVEEWRNKELELSLPDPTDAIQLRPQSTRKMETKPLEETIKRRGSTRNFNHDFLDFTKFSNVLKMGTQPFHADFYSEFGTRFTRVYVIANAVDDLQMGSYRFYPEKNQLQPLKQGYMREETKRLGLNQALAHDCAAMVVFIADIGALLSVYGNRGYRVAQLEASILGGKMYLAAYAQGLGATGLTFEDDAVTEFFDESGKIVTFMILLGHKAKKSKKS